MEKVYIRLGRMFPVKFKENTDQLIKYAGGKVSSDLWLGRSLFIGFLIILLFLPLMLFVDSVISLIFLGVVSFLAYEILSYLILFFKADNRSHAIDNALPGFLQLVSANINAGMTPFQAMKASSRIEFGLLKDEIDRVINLSLGAKPFTDSLFEMTSRIRSPTFEKVIRLFVEGMETGGKMSGLLEDLSRDIFENLELKHEMITRSRTYIFFISFAVIIGTPLLFAVSIGFINTITGVIEDIEVPEMYAVSGITIGEFPLTADFLVIIATSYIIITSLIASLLIAYIHEGKGKYIVKYAAILVSFSLATFYSINYVLVIIFEFFS